MKKPPTPRANAISRVLSRLWDKATPEQPGFAVYQVGPGLVHIQYHDTGKLTAMCQELYERGYNANIRKIEGTETLYIAVFK